MLFFLFGRCPKNCSTSIARKKLFCPTLGGWSPPALPSSYAYVTESTWSVQFVVCEPDFTVRTD